MEPKLQNNNEGARRECLLRAERSLLWPERRLALFLVSLVSLWRLLWFGEAWGTSFLPPSFLGFSSGFWPFLKKIKKCFKLPNFLEKEARSLINPFVPLFPKRILRALPRERAGGASYEPKGASFGQKGGWSSACSHAFCSLPLLTFFHRDSSGRRRESAAAEPPTSPKEARFQHFQDLFET